jgi:hypothetical protein
MTRHHRRAMRMRTRIDRSRGAATHRADRNDASESAAAIRAKNRFWRALMRREAGEHENFLIAKNHDSESAQRAFEWHR